MTPGIKTARAKGNVVPKVYKTRTVLRSENVQARKDIKELKHQITQTQAERTKVETQLAKTLKQATDQCLRIHTLEMDNELLRASHRTLTVDLTEPDVLSLQREVELLQSKNQRLMAEIERCEIMQRNNKLLNNEIENRESDISTMKQEIGRLEKDAEKTCEWKAKVRAAFGGLTGVMNLLAPEDDTV